MILLLYCAARQHGAPTLLFVTLRTPLRETRDVMDPWVHAPLPDATCVSDTHQSDFAALSPKLLPSTDPFRCSLANASACGTRGQCVGYSELYDIHWSRDDDADDTCFWLAFAEAFEAYDRELTDNADDAALWGLCRCTGNFEGDGCAACASGWAGDACDEPYVATRRDLEAYSETELVPIKAAFTGFVVPGGMLDWVHNTSTLDYPSSCSGAAHNPHQGSVWLMQWHRPLLRLSESVLVQRGLEGLPYWRPTTSGSWDAVLALHPELQQGDLMGCGVADFRTFADALGMTRGNLLCKSEDLPAGVNTSEACLASEGITVDAVFDDDALLGMEYLQFLEGIKHLHVYTHCWFTATRYVVAEGNVCNEAAFEFAMTAATASSDAEMARCASATPIYSDIDVTPLFFMFHSYLDYLLERWMARHGYDAACDADLRDATDGTWSMGRATRDQHPDACVMQSLLGGVSYALKDSCAPCDAAWGYAFEAPYTHTDSSGGGGGGGVAVVDSFAGYWWGVITSVYVMFVARLMLRRRSARRKAELVAVQEDGRSYDMQPNQATVRAGVRTVGD